MTTVSILSPCIIFINTDLTNSVIQTFTNQFYLTATLTAEQFDANAAANPNYAISIHTSDQRIMVLRNLSDHTNRALADIVLFAKNGLVAVECNKYGPHGATFPIASVSLPRLFSTTPTGLVRTCPCHRPDLDDGFVGEIDDDNFDAIVPSPLTDPLYGGTGKSSF